MPVRRVLMLLAALMMVAVSAACTEVEGTEGKNFVTSDGIVVEIAAEKRSDPVEVSGETLDGGALDLAELRGEIVIVNVWGAWCTECIREAPMLAEAQQELPDGARIVGIDIRDSGRDQPRRFEERFGIEYPSIYDPGSTTLLNFPPPYNPREIPSTMVLDRSGRVAALVRGTLPSKLTLLNLVEKVAAEDGPSAEPSAAADDEAGDEASNG